IYNVTGVCVMSMRVDSNDKRFDLNLHRGCYIVKVGKTVRKISVY
ncbi:MAG: T9SS C-terminal target domain-containing protein, partial [Segatella salivae]